MLTGIPRKWQRPLLLRERPGWSPVLARPSSSECQVPDGGHLSELSAARRNVVSGRPRILNVLTRQQVDALTCNS